MIQGKPRTKKPSSFCFTFANILIWIWYANRFKGELYGVGTNHTKYKTNYVPKSNNNGNGISSGGANSTNNNNNNTNQYPQLQFSSTVHYPASGNFPITQSPATTAFGYDEAY